MGNRWIRYLAPALLFTALFFGCSRKPGEKLYAEGVAEWKAGNRVRARTLIEKSIRRRPGSAVNADAYNQLGLLLWEMNETDAAVEAFSESCRLQAGQFEPLCNLGAALCARGEFEAAERILREAALLRPDDARPLVYAGLAYLRNRKWEEARRNLQHAAARAPRDARLETALALADLHAAGPDAALARLREVTARDAAFAPALFNIASVYRHWLNNPAEAARWYERFLGQTAGATNAFAAEARKQLDLAAGSARVRLPFTPPAARDRKAAEKLFQQAVAQHKAGRIADALKGYLKTLETDDAYEPAMYNLGLAYYAEGRLDLARAAFDEVLRLNPDAYAARYNGALTDYRLGRYDRARRELEAVLRSQPGYQPALDLQKQMLQAGGGR